MHQKPFEEIMEKLKEFSLPEEFDLIVGIARGGVVPAFMLSRKLECDLSFLWLLYRNENNEPIFEEPRLIRDINFDYKEKRILLVDDRLKTGRTFLRAKEILKEAAKIKTFAVNGHADYSLYNEPCFTFPWKI